MKIAVLPGDVSGPRHLRQGLRTADIMQPGMKQLGTAAMGDAVLAALG